MADKDPAQELKKMLVQAKTKEMRFAFIKQGTGGKLLVCPKNKKIPKEDIDAARKGGGSLLTGFCSGPPDDLVFKARMTSDPSPALNEAIKKAANTAGAGALIKKAQVVRMLPGEGDGEEVSDDAEAAAPVGGATPPGTDDATGTGPSIIQPPAALGETAAPPPAGQAGPTAGGDLKADVTKRYSDLAGPLKEASTQKTPDAERMKSLTASGKSLLLKKDYEGAAKVLEELEPLVAKFTQQKADYKTRKEEIQADMTKATDLGKDAGKYKKAIDAADKLVKTNIADALAALDQAKGEADAEIKSAEEERQKVTTKQAEVNKKIADLEKDANIAAHLAPQIADAKSKVDAAVKLADPPGRDYAAALAALAAVDSACDAAQKLIKDYQGVLAKKAEADKKIAELEKLPNAANVAPEIAVSKQKVVNALKLADPPGHDYATALKDLTGVIAACVSIKQMTEDYQKVLTLKADTDKKIARLDNHPQKNLISSEIAAIKAQEAAALALANPPGHDYMGATNALAAVDKQCAHAEIMILDKLVTGSTAGTDKTIRMDRGDMRDLMKKAFKERFGVELDMEKKGDSATEEYMAVRRIYELMAMVPESHTNRNPSLKKIERIGGPGGGPSEVSYYESTTDVFLGLGTKDSKKIVLHCDRPSPGGTGLQNGLVNPATGRLDPPVDPDCQPKPTASTSQSYFDWTTLHEIAHAIDDKTGFMKKKANADIAGWVDYGKDCSAAAQAAAAFFNFNTADAIKYIKKLMEGKPGNRPGSKPDAPSGRPDWNTVRQNVENWCDSIRVNRDPWNNMPADLSGRIYHESYEGFWVSYKKAARSQGIRGYQFRAPGEWFSELYAAYHSGVLQDTHPMVKKFLKDL